MTVPVALSALAEQVESFEDVVYLVTVSQDTTPHVVSVTATWQGDELVVGAGRHTSHNVEVNSRLTLLWPAPAGSPYSLIVDGSARLVPDDQAIAISPTRAVLHRVAGADASLPSCVTVLETADG
ncbi:MAG TPA: pyridoxamine 5'-phosphate oxidase family protein [Acidimicrobiales bacterium]|nr:pyridoxamine 5'-phosphate oxidase family protein [Acidimicrobiales bacterium]